MLRVACPATKYYYPLEAMRNFTLCTGVNSHRLSYWLQFCSYEPSDFRRRVPERILAFGGTHFLSLSKRDVRCSGCLNSPMLKDLIHQGVYETIGSDRSRATSREASY